jgi:undecaprenyl-diphosphatase
VLDGVVRDVTSLGGVAIATTTAITAIALSRRSRFSVLQIALGGIGGAVSELGIKRWVARPRPKVVPHLQYVSTPSFPSGHAIAASALYLSIAFVARRRLRRPHERVAVVAAAAKVAAVVGASRVYLGVHYPTDVLGGLALGTAWACLLEAVFEFTGAHSIERPARDARALAFAGS